ncbi:MAG: anti-sigma factor antagonist [Frankiales bacterium]|nr:anti-sigma factor antagonist [Frankiales bacterium]
MTGTVHGATSPSGRTVVLTPIGEQDVATVPVLRDALDRALTGRVRVVVVDLQHVPFLDATTAGALLAAHARCRTSVRDLVVVNVLPGPARTLRLLDPGRQLPMVTQERVLGPAWGEAGARPPPSHR